MSGCRSHGSMANAARERRSARKRQCDRCGKQHRHRSKQCEYIGIHEPVPPTDSNHPDYQPNQGRQAENAGAGSGNGCVDEAQPRRRQAGPVAPVASAASQAAGFTTQASRSFIYLNRGGCLLLRRAWCRDEFRPFIVRRDGMGHQFRGRPRPRQW